MAITRTAWIDDDGSGTTGTVINNAEKTLLYDQIDAALVVNTTSPEHHWTEVTTNAVGVQNDFNPGIVGDTIIRCGNPSLLTITGLASSAAKTPGQRVRFIAIGAQIDLCYYDSRSLTANRLVNYASSAPTSLAPGTTPTRAFAEYQWSSPDGQWILRAHEQGAWITPPFNAANYGASAGTWTVAAGNVGPGNTYLLRGRVVQVQFAIVSSSISATPQWLTLGNAAWGGFTGPAYAALPNYVAVGSAQVTDAAVNSVGGMCQFNNNVANNALLLYKPGTANWAVTSGGCNVYGTILVPVT